MRGETEEEGSTTQPDFDRPPRPFSTVGAAEALLVSEATVMARPSGPHTDARNDDDDDGATRRWSSLPQRMTSPPPRRAVILPGDVDEICGESRSDTLANPDGREALASTAAAASRDGTTEGMAPRADAVSITSSFSFRRGEESLPGELADDANDDEEARSSRTSSTTPPPRRAFVLSRRCSPASSAVVGKPLEDAEGEQNTAEHTLLQGETAADIAAQRGSEVLVTGSAVDARRCFAQPAISERHRPRRRCRSSDVEVPRTAVDGDDAVERVNDECADEAATAGAVCPHLTLPSDPPHMVRRVSGEGDGDGDETGPATGDDASTARHGTAAVNTTEQDTTTTATLPFSPPAVRESTELRLSDFMSGSSRSSMMSPLPRPVPPHALTAAVSRPLRISPAHSREDDTEEGMNNVVAAVRKDTKDSGTPTHSDAAMTVVADGSAVHSPHDDPPHQRVATHGVSEEGGVAAPQDSLVARHMDDASHSATRTTTMTTTTTAMSSLWLVNGPTPTPLRRLRGDEEEEATDETEGSAPRRREAYQSEAAPEERVAANGGNGTAAETQTSPQRSAALSLTSEPHNESGVSASPEAQAATMATTTTSEKETRELSDMQKQQEGQCSGDGTSCSPEPQRPAELPPRTTEALLTASISPVPSLDRQARRQHCGELDIKETATAGGGVELMPLPSHNTHTRVDLDLMQPVSPPPSTPAVTPTRSSLGQPNHTRHSPAVETRRSVPHVGTAKAVTSVPPPSPSSRLSESARVSEEVRELVERAQAEVARTRASLLATLRDHRADFHMRDVSPTRRQQLGCDAMASPTPTRRSLALPPVTTAATAATASAATSLSPNVIKTPDARQPPTSTARTPEELRSAAATLRPQLSHAADAILRRLQGYDERGHGVLPLEKVVRVTFFVLRRRQMPVTAWTLRTVDGGIASTPMRASMVDRTDTPHNRLLGSRYDSNDDHHSRCADKACATPFQQRLSRQEDVAVHTAANVVLPQCATPSSMSSGCCGTKHFRSSDHTGDVSTASTTKTDGSGAVTRQTCESGGSVTFVSPTRTLESIMARQERRAEEESYLNFYLTVVEAFKQVFGERYAWRHLGATNASRHDAVVASKRAKVEHTGTTTLNPTSEAEQDLSEGWEESDNELNHVPAPLETVFPRLRQQYALRQDGARMTPGMGLALRPPPLDVLVYYHTFTDSLREL
jgi:hypothetical protein